ncbi:hypothetical protein [Pseudomonas sp. I2]|uniref:hypothetical protein n=1 Tax=Pseudomonas sp. I2 TaxID=1338438 RepID=UPI0034D4804A
MAKLSGSEKVIRAIARETAWAEAGSFAGVVNGGQGDKSIRSLPTLMAVSFVSTALIALHICAVDAANGKRSAARRITWW